jgi:transketolase
MVLPDINNILAVEAGVGDCWDKFIGKKGSKIVMNSFGLSAPGNIVLNHFGFSIKNIITTVKKLIKNNGKGK